MRSAILSSAQGERHFRWRGRHVSRVENLSDIVFAMALTLIAASSVPTTFDGLIDLWRDGLAMAGSFALLLLLWRSHYVFFRRYDLEDGATTLLNAVLLFLVMAFAYPLKFLTLFLVDLVSLALSGQFNQIGEILTMEQARILTAIYSAGYASVFAVLALMYRHAASRHEALGLTQAERELTRLEIRVSIAHVAFAATAAIAAATLGRYGVWAGMVYFGIGPVLSVIMTRGQNKAARLAEAAGAQAASG